MKKIFLFLSLVFLTISAFGQSQGISYQAVIYSPDVVKVPGQDNMMAPLTNQDICMRFNFFDTSSSLEYQETVNISTDEFGMVNFVVGKSNQTNGYANNFNDIVWDGSAKNF